MKKSRVIITVLLAGMMIAILVNPARYIKSASDGLLVFSLNVLPALFPFMFLTKIMTELGALTRISKGLGKFTGKFYRVPPSAGYVFLMSLISGYPVGAKLISEFHEKNFLSDAECSRASSFCSTSGPLFVLGTVGTSMLLSLKAGAVILAAHALGALVNGLIYRGYRKREDIENPKYAPQQLTQNDNWLYDSIYSAVTSILIVGGYITLFYVAIDILNDFRILAPLKFALGKFLTLFSLPAHAGEGLANGLLEATRGCLDLSRMGLSLTAASTLCCFLLSFGGFSIFMQAYTFLSRCKVRAGFYLIAKLTHAVISAVLCLALCFLFRL